MYKLPLTSSGSKGLSALDYIDSAREIGCSVAAIKAVAEVESSGGGFLLDGRPKILFEAHKFSEYTKRRFDATHPNISSVSWNRKLYRGGIGEYSRLQAAIELDHVAALKSASWGRFQILGANHLLCKFATVELFVAAHFHNENEQLDAFVSFVKSRKLDGHMRTGNWAGFALGYNGRRYKENNYDVKLAAAEQKYQKGLT